jgi:hypothetical protein
MPSSDTEVNAESAVILAIATTFALCKIRSRIRPFSQACIAPYFAHLRPSPDQVPHLHFFHRSALTPGRTLASDGPAQANPPLADWQGDGAVPSIEFRQQLYPLRSGENLIGPSERSTIRLPDLPEGCVLGISVESLGSFAWSAGENGIIDINGQRLGREPVPLFSSDQISIQDATLVFPMTFIDDASESTDRVMARAGARRPPAAVAGDLVESTAGSGAVSPEMLTRMTPPVAQRKVVAVVRRLDDGQAYAIDGGFRIGREKHCDLIIPDQSVSRLHAEINFTAGQYVLREVGRTETKVNGKKVHGNHTLAVGDIIRIGNVELAFLRRPETAEEIFQPGDVTPVRGSIPDAPTEMPRRPKAARGSRGFNYVLLTLLLIMLGVILFG